MRELSPYEQTVVDTADDFGKTVIAPNAQSWNKQGRVPEAVFKQAAALGLCRLLVPESLGGLSLSVSALAAVMSSLAKHCFASTFSFVVHNNLAANIARNASETLRNDVLPAMMQGSRVGAFLLTDPQGGSDAAGITTQAVASPSGWMIDGVKAWVSNGSFADVLSVYAQTDPQAGSRGIGCFLIDAQTPGVIREAPYQLMGGHALGTSGFTFQGCEVGLERVLVAPGRGFRAAMQGIDLARINVAAMCCGMLESALATAMEMTSKRRAFGQAVINFQGLQWMLADVATDLEAAKALTWRAAELADLGEGATIVSAHAKKFATRVALNGIAQCMQAMGADGLRTDHPLARHLAAAKMSQFMDGTSEIQNVVISRELMKSS